jgi:hypothetical protein
MPTATQNVPELLNIGQATADQLSRWLSFKMEKGSRIMAARMDNGFLLIFYRTKSGYYVAARFDQYGEHLKREFFHNWNENDGEPCNLVFPPPVNPNYE